MKRPLIRLSLLLLTCAVACAVAYRLIGARVEADGTLREAFALIPIGYSWAEPVLGPESPACCGGSQPSAGKDQYRATSERYMGGS